MMLSLGESLGLDAGWREASNCGSSYVGMHGGRERPK
jgi:hypothetical protein